MPTYISLLRGINVGGKRTVKIEELKRLYESFGLENVRTYIQSGNLVFCSRSEDEGPLARSIESEIRDELGLDVTVILRTREELEELIRRNPFMKSNPRETDKLHVTFLSDTPDTETVVALDMTKTGRDRFKISGREVFLYCPNGYGRTKLTNNLFEKSLGVRATTRNWATVNKLLDKVRE
jgi:uncharacterized protein (DUF1697 family)